MTSGAYLIKVGVLAEHLVQSVHYYSLVGRGPDEFIVVGHRGVDRRAGAPVADVLEFAVGGLPGRDDVDASLRLGLTICERVLVAEFLATYSVSTHTEV